MLDRKRVRAVMDIIEKAIRESTVGIGVEVAKVSGSFQDTNLRMTVTLNDTDMDSVEKLTERKGLDQQCVGCILGIGESFTSFNGTIYVITDFNLRRQKYPVSGRGPQGGRYKFTVANVNASKEARAKEAKAKVKTAVA